MNEDIRHPLFARFYARLSVGLERRGSDDHRERLVAGLRGRVVEVGAGNGLNFCHYPDTVTEVLAVEPEPYLRRLAEEAVRSASVPIRVVPGKAERLPVEDDSQDAVVLSLVLCSVREPDHTLGEVMRVLRPGGEVRFYEHVVSSNSLGAGVQRVLDATIWPPIMGGCHLARESRRSIEMAGFALDQCERFPFGTPPIPHILGTAHKLADGTLRSTS